MTGVVDGGVAPGKAKDTASNPSVVANLVSEDDSECTE